MKSCQRKRRESGKVSDIAWLNGKETTTPSHALQVTVYPPTKPYLSIFTSLPSPKAKYRHIRNRAAGIEHKIIGKILTHKQLVKFKLASSIQDRYDVNLFKKLIYKASKK